MLAPYKRITHFPPPHALQVIVAAGTVSVELVPHGVLFVIVLVIFLRVVEHARLLLKILLTFAPAI
jgi:hypothetical protein